MWLFSFLSSPRSPRLASAEAELRAELREFTHDGLVQLGEDLEHDIAHQDRIGYNPLVKRGTWRDNAGRGCVLSYRRGYAGSVNKDRNGKDDNAFTRLWDAEKVPQRCVLELVRKETARRPAHEAPAFAPTTVHAEPAGWTDPVESKELVGVGADRPW